jgi:hypothetical protein
MRATGVPCEPAEIRAAAEEIRPGFVMMPNGHMVGFDQLNGRRVDGKNVMLNAPGSDVILYENEMYPGTIASGFTFDLERDRLRYCTTAPITVRWV